MSAQTIRRIFAAIKVTAASEALNKHPVLPERRASARKRGFASRMPSSEVPMKALSSPTSVAFPKPVLSVMTEYSGRVGEGWGSCQDVARVGAGQGCHPPDGQRPRQRAGLNLRQAVQEP